MLHLIGQLGSGIKGKTTTPTKDLHNQTLAHQINMHAVVCIPFICSFVWPFFQLLIQPFVCTFFRLFVGGLIGFRIFFLLYLCNQDVHLFTVYMIGLELDWTKICLHIFLCFQTQINHKDFQNKLHCCWEILWVIFHSSNNKKVMWTKMKPAESVFVYKITNPNSCCTPARLVWN